MFCTFHSPSETHFNNIFYMHILFSHFPFQVPFRFPFIRQTSSDHWKAIHVPTSSPAFPFVKTKATTTLHTGSVMLSLLFACVKQSVRKVSCTQRWQSWEEKTKKKIHVSNPDGQSNARIYFRPKFEKKENLSQYRPWSPAWRFLSARPAMRTEI